MLYFNEYKDLVDNLLAVHLLEVDITPEAFKEMMIDRHASQQTEALEAVEAIRAAEEYERSPPPEPAPAPPPPPAPSVAERSFGAAGGAYGRAVVGS